MSHPTAPAGASRRLVSTLTEVRALLADLSDLDPVFTTPQAQGDALQALSAISAQVSEVEARLLTHADRDRALPYSVGATNAAGWLTVATRATPRHARARVRFAHTVDSHPLVAAALREGAVTQAQAAQICDSLMALPAEVDDDTRGAATQHLIGLADRFHAGELRVLGRKVLDVVAPEAAEAHEARALAREERRARSITRLTFTHRGDGTTRISATVPDLTATRLATFLHAFTSPRHRSTCTTGTANAGRTEPDLWLSLPYPDRLGEAFCELMERIDPAALPQHGSRPTQVVVTIPLASLRADLGAATVLGPDGVERISADEARRLACTANIIPAVLGSHGEVLDLGRSQRLASQAQRLALAVQHPTCRALGCDKPAPWTEAHHHDPWSAGGRTDLSDMVLLCGHHHRTIHDPTMDHTREADGTIRFRRRAP